MKITCSWCKRDMGYKAPIDDNSVSHGMCPECLKRQQAEVEEYFAVNPLGQEARCGNTGKTFPLWGR